VRGNVNCGSFPRHFDRLDTERIGVLSVQVFRHLLKLLGDRVVPQVTDLLLVLDAGFTHVPFSCFLFLYLMRCNLPHVCHELEMGSMFAMNRNEHGGKQHGRSCHM
jgi:hypothetical protein